MRYVKPRRLKAIMIMFFGTGAFGIVAGLGILGNEPIFMMSLMGAINIVLGGFFGWVLLSQEPKSEQRRKKYGK